jgi:protoheme IX farnesyltransferase
VKIHAEPTSLTASSRFRAYLALTKPRIIELLLTTAVPTMFLAAGGLPSLRVTIAVLIGGALSAGGANTLNSVYDRDIDALMHRTEARPAAVGVISARAGVIQGVILAVLSALTLGLLTNWLSAGLSLVAIAMYVFGYTMWLKRRTPQNIVWGGAAGCMPVLIAWSAVTGGLSLTPVILFLIVFFWTPPHYWPLAMKYREDYANAGVPMLPVVRNDLQVTASILRYSWVMVAVSLSLIWVAPMGWIYAATAVLVGAVFLYMAHRLRRAAKANDPEINATAMRLFHWSITYLALLFLAVAIDPFVG